MQSDIILNFNVELTAIHNTRAPSKTLIQQITKAAMKGRFLYKHVVFSIERFLDKCRPHHRIHVLYLVDSIVRTSKRAFPNDDPFSERFLLAFPKMMKILLNVKPIEKLKVVRILNLWQANGVFTKEELAPFLKYCQDVGLNTDPEYVEREVKGDAADMRIYGGKYVKKSTLQRSTTPPMPPPPLQKNDGLLGDAPSKPTGPSFEPSNEIIDGVISEKDMLDLIQSNGFEGSRIYAEDHKLLQSAHSIFVGSLKAKIETHNQLIAQSKSLNPDNIKNVLTKDFDYSDDEDEKEEEPAPQENDSLSHQDIVNMAAEMFNNENVVKALQTMITERENERLAQMAQTAPPQISLPPNLQIPPNMAHIALSEFNKQYLATASKLVDGSQLARFPPPNVFSQMPQLQASNLMGLLNPQLLQSLPMLPNMGLLPPNAQTGQPGASAPQITLPPMGVPPPNMNNPNDVHAAAQKQMRLIETEMENDEDARRAKEGEKAKEKERRKMGLPSIKPGITYIASRTLWLKKVPPNCSENDLKSAVEANGEVSRVKIIGNRACAYVTMESRKAAADVVNKIKEVTVSRKPVKVNWARAPGMNEAPFSEMWDIEKGVIAIPHDQLPVKLDTLCEGAVLDLESLPENKRSMYKETGEIVTPTNIAPPAIGQLNIELPKAPNAAYPPPFAPFPGIAHHHMPPGVPPPPGMPHNFQPAKPGGTPLMNLNMPPPGPPGTYPMPPMMPPPGVPPAFNPSQPPPPGGNFSVPPPAARPGLGAPPSFAANRGAYRGGGSSFNRGRGGFEGTRGGYDGGRTNYDGGRAGFENERNGPNNRGAYDGGRGRYEDRYDRRDRDRDRGRDRSGDRRGDERRRTSRWGRDERDDRREDRREERRDERRRSHDRRSDRWERDHSNDRRELRRSPNYDEGDQKKVAAGDETVSSTTLDDVKPAPERVPSASADEKKVDERKVDGPATLHVDRTEEVPMDLE
ncbi:unnamed protein product [Caenorhabditis bovis]|uniref:CID domain-containing protein n=1 Tax=Caenorhabditis bovis TaxID=2654633 RepID=A0A8S1F823_9PELO|nr:unnamed protein product [Caenorhabditis bovis]